MVGKYRKIIKATFLVTKNPAFTDEEFREYYINKHMPLAAGHCQKHGVLEYNVQFNTSSDVKVVGDLLGPAAATIDCDAITTFIFPDLESLRGAFADPDYAATLQPDEQRFTNGTKVRLAISDEYMLVSGGMTLA